MAVSTSGVIAGGNPIEYSSSSPYTLFFLQMILLLVFIQLLNYPLSKIKEPKVIAEVLAGIILGPTALGQIPGFTDNIFPTESRSGLTLVSTIGICLLLFMVGCEVDTKFMRKHLPMALSVGIVNMAVPFGLGCAFSVALWRHYRSGLDADIEFTTFMVFIGVSMCITAFPVLVRILTELRLLKDRVGTVVLAAGITNDLIGWILLALSVTLANATDPAVTGYIVLVAIGWALFICYPVRYALKWVLDKQMHDLDNPSGPSTLCMLIMIVLMFISAFFTDIIGVHPIFGAFLVGAIIPRDNNYVIRLTARIEDLVNLVFAPIYFGIAGLNADLSLLNEGIDWAYIVGLIGIAILGKILGGMVPARIMGLFWRESLTVGVLMSCKGIVEIVVLQTGLKAGIISNKLFAMFILMALVSTFLTTPLTLLTYPQSYRESAAVRRSEKPTHYRESSVPSVMEVTSTTDSSPTPPNQVAHRVSKSLIKNYNKVNFDRLILPVDGLESVSNNLILVDRFCIATGMPMHAVNLKQLTERTADLLHASMMRDMDDQFDQFDGQYLNALLSILKVFCELNGVPFTSELVFALPNDMLESLMSNNNYMKSDLLILTVGSKYYSQHASTLTQFLRYAQEAKYYHALFINNNQNIGNLRELERDKTRQIGNSLKRQLTRQKEWTDTASLLSNETILNPRSFEISTVTLVASTGDVTRDQLVALRLFSILVSHGDVDQGYVLSSENETADLFSLVKGEIEGDVKLQSCVLGSDEEKSYKDYVFENCQDRDSNKIDELFIVTKGCPFRDELLQKLVDLNQKILVVA